MKREHMQRSGSVNGKPERGAQQNSAPRTSDVPSYGKENSGQDQSDNLPDAPLLQASPAIPTEFSFNGSGMRSVQIGTESWFLAADVCALLEYANSRDAITRLEDDEKGVAQIDTLGGSQQMNVINESGLYNLIFGSTKPEAKAFRRWVTGVVLPSIRQTGGYDLRRAPQLPEAAAEAKTATVALPRFGRFVVTCRPGRAIHIHETEAVAAYDDMLATDCQLLSHWLRTIEAFWHKVQHLKARGLDIEGGFALSKLEGTILEGGRLGRHYLACYDPADHSQARQQMTTQ